LRRAAPARRAAPGGRLLHPQPPGASRRRRLRAARRARARDGARRRDLARRRGGDRRPPGRAGARRAGRARRRRGGGRRRDRGRSAGGRARLRVLRPAGPVRPRRLRVKIRIITASAGSGKTTRLSQVLDEAIAEGRVRPDGIVATTFTRQAAAELTERARSRLLAGGRGREAHQLLAARIGTVNAVCGTLVADYAFELGLSPRLRVLDEDAAEIEQKRALASVVSAE